MGAITVLHSRPGFADVVTSSESIHGQGAILKALEWTHQYHTHITKPEGAACVRVRECS